MIPILWVKSWGYSWDARTRAVIVQNNLSCQMTVMLNWVVYEMVVVPFNTVLFDDDMSPMSMMTWKKNQLVMQQIVSFFRWPPFANNSIILELDRKTHRHQVNIPPRELIHTNFLHPTPSYGAGKLRILASDGTPSLSTINNMYQPVPKRETI
jgi:hypothetical protein